MAKKSKNEKETETELDFSDEIKRLNRIGGQIEGIKKMLGEARGLDAMLTQCKAVHSALKGVETRILAHYVTEAAESLAKADKKKGREQKINELLELYRPV